MKYVFFIDIDGTLQSDNGIISNRCRNIIRNIVSIGNEVVLCTARPRIHAKQISDNIGASRYILTSNGAELYDYIKDKIIFTNAIPKKTVISVMKKVFEYGLNATLAIDDIEYIIGKKYNEYQKKIPNNYEEFLNKVDVKQFMIIEKGNDLEKLRKIRKYVSDLNDVVLTSKHDIKEAQGNWFSFVKNDTSKGNGIVKYAESFSVPIKNIISIGNDFNDISMFDQSGIRVAVKNATEDILMLADEITDSNNNDGVAKILEKFYLNLL